ncbi:hypothetical protein ASE59_11635 [Sphingomonas sp. Leaf10]|nr:hypothetical protein ASE59_11635 [Sphingomonas sp. Leaf10]
MGLGVRVTWGTLPGKPSTFVPVPHTHPWADVTGKPDSYPPSVHSHAWGDITDKPAVFPPASHTHAYSSLTGIPTTFAPSSHTHLWADITDKPATFAPSAHTHLWADITDRPTIPAATPLGTTPALALGTASAGTSTNAAREDHAHPMPAGRLSLIGTATVGETTVLALALGVKRYTVAMSGLVVGDRIIAILTGAPGASSLQDVYVSGANTLNVGLLNPALGIGSTIAVPIAVYKVT